VAPYTQTSFRQISSFFRYDFLGMEAMHPSFLWREVEGGEESGMRGACSEPGCLIRHCTWDMRSVVGCWISCHGSGNMRHLLIQFIG